MPVRTGGGGVVIALVAVAVVVLLVLGAAVLLLVTGGDDDDPDRTTARPATTAESPATESTDGGTETTADPGTTEAPTPTDPLPTDPVPTDPVPTDPVPTGGTDLALPEGFPVPDGAAVGASGLLEVPDSDAAQVRDFYVAELPAAGYSVDDVTEVGGSTAITVSGPESGTLVIVDLGTLPTTVGWSGT